MKLIMILIAAAGFYVVQHPEVASDILAAAKAQMSAVTAEAKAVGSVAAAVTAPEAPEAVATHAHYVSAKTEPSFELPVVVEGKRPPVHFDGVRDTSKVRSMSDADIRAARDNQEIQAIRTRLGEIEAEINAREARGV